MKIIKNINLSLSLNKGRNDLMYESLEEILEFYQPIGGMLKHLQQCRDNKKTLGFVKCHTFDEEEGDFDFIQIYKDDFSDQFEILHENVRVYGQYLIITASEGDFRSKMLRIDRGNTEGTFKFEDF